jgi:hypothetical protein
LETIQKALVGSNVADEDGFTEVVSKSSHKKNPLAGFVTKALSMKILYWNIRGMNMSISDDNELHKSVTTPREQVADAEVLLDITKSLAVFVKPHFSGGLTPSTSVTHILDKFGKGGGTSTSREDCSRNSIAW